MRTGLYGVRALVGQQVSKMVVGLVTMLWTLHPFHQSSRAGQCRPFHTHRADELPVQVGVVVHSCADGLALDCAVVHVGVPEIRARS